MLIYRISLGVIMNPVSLILRSSLYRNLMILSVLFIFSGSIFAKDSMTDTFADRIPRRPLQAMTGTEFAKSIQHLKTRQREQAILNQLNRGNIPDFLRKLVPVHFESSRRNGKKSQVTFYTMPDYLAIGSNKDFLRIPVNYHTAVSVARRFGFVLPTRKMVDAIYSRAAFHLKPRPMTPGPWMTSTAYYLTHQQKIEKSRRAIHAPLGALIAGHKKDLILTHLLERTPHRVAIYGWHRLNGQPIQPVSLVHGANYADYSHGVRLISDVIQVDGQLLFFYDIMEDPDLATLLTGEGTIRNLMALMEFPPNTKPKEQKLTLSSISGKEQLQGL